MPFYCGERSADICIVLGPKKSSTYSSEYASGFFEPAASHLPAPPSPRHEGLLGQAPSPTNEDRLRTLRMRFEYARSAGQRRPHCAARRHQICMVDL